MQDRQDSWLLKFELKGKLGDFFLFVKSFYRPKTKTSFNRQFSPKRPKLVKNQAKGSEIHQIRTKWHPSYCGNPSILSSDLAVKIKRSLQGSPVENKMLRSWMFFALQYNDRENCLLKLVLVLGQ